MDAGGDAILGLVLGPILLAVLVYRAHMQGHAARPNANVQLLADRFDNPLLQDSERRIAA